MLSGCKIKNIVFSEGRIDRRASKILLILEKTQTFEELVGIHVWIKKSSTGYFIGKSQKTIAAIL